MQPWVKKAGKESNPTAFWACEYRCEYAAKPHSLNRRCDNILDAQCGSLHGTSLRSRSGGTAVYVLIVGLAGPVTIHPSFRLRRSGSE